MRGPALPRGASTDLRARFERERRLLASFGEADGFVPILDAGESEHGAFVVMPFVAGGTLRDRLRREPLPHVLHFLGHGSVVDDKPVLGFVDADGEATWLPVELLAQQLKAGFRGVLRLIVLEACEGARPGAFATAAETLARAGADAVVAHLSTVKVDVARACSEHLYRALAGSDHAKGDVAVALNDIKTDNNRLTLDRTKDQLKSAEPYHFGTSRQ